ncbi:MAG: hypothetical protein LC104_08370 [Bacteroidales bacterium]|nr:hypothetical protein [Bacteroidales bacterium]
MKNLRESIKIVGHLVDWDYDDPVIHGHHFIPWLRPTPPLHPLMDRGLATNQGKIPVLLFHFGGVA